MTKALSINALNATLQYVATNSNQLTICSGYPADFYAAVYPSAWVATTAYALNSVVRPTVWNGFVYKCTTAGTSGSTQPTWPTSAGATVGDGTVTWTAVASLVLAQTSITSADFGTIVTISTGQQMPYNAVSGIVSVTAGQGTYVVYVNTNGNELPSIDLLSATIVVPNPGTVNLNATTLTIDQPT